MNTLASQFAAEVTGMTNEQIATHLEGKPAGYVDNFDTDHSGHEFEPVKFTFPDDSLLFIHDWNEETPRFQTSTKAEYGDETVSPEQEIAERAAFVASLRDGTTEHSRQMLNGHPDNGLYLEFDETVWFGWAKYTLNGHSANVVAYLAETIMDEDPDLGKVAVQQAIRAKHGDNMDDILFA